MARSASRSRSTRAVFSAINPVAVSTGRNLRRGAEDPQPDGDSGNSGLSSAPDPVEPDPPESELAESELAESELSVDAAVLGDDDGDADAVAGDAGDDDAGDDVVAVVGDADSTAASVPVVDGLLGLAAVVDGYRCVGVLRAGAWKIDVSNGGTTGHGTTIGGMAGAGAAGAGATVTVTGAAGTGTAGAGAGAGAGIWAGAGRGAGGGAGTGAGAPGATNTVRGAC